MDFNSRFWGTARIGKQVTRFQFEFNAISEEDARRIAKDLSKRYREIQANVSICHGSVNTQFVFRE